MESAVSIRNLSKKYEGFEIKNLNLEIPKGYIIGMIGKNGAGKTTILKSVIDMVKPDSGEIFVFGKNIRDNGAELRNRIGVVLGSGNYYDNLTLKQNKNIFASFYTHWDEQAFERYCKLFELSLNKKVEELSTGMRVKFTIALALSHRAELLLMDEPTAGLDPIVRDEMLEMIMEIIQDEQRSVIFSTHITSDLDKIADYIVLINNGKIELNEPKDDLLERHAVMKGSASGLTKQQRDALIGYTEHDFGFAGLTAQKELFRTAPFVAEKPTTEDIMIFYTKNARKKGEKACF